MQSQTFNALCNHGFDVFKISLQVNARVILKFQVNYNLKLRSRISSTISKLQSRIPITSQIQSTHQIQIPNSIQIPSYIKSNTNYCISNAFWSRGKNAVNERRASTTRPICDQEPLFNEQYLKSNRGYLKYVRVCQARISAWRCAYRWKPTSEKYVIAASCACVLIRWTRCR